MFRFENPNMFYCLIAILILVLLFHLGMYIQKKRLKSFGNPSLLASLMPNVSTIRPYVKFYFLVVVLVLMIVALARPQMGTKVEDSKTEGVEVMFVLDVSKSMLSQDVTPSRLDNAKLMLSKLIDKMSEDKVGMVVFAGDAFVQLPMTTDNVSAKMFLSTINTNTVPRPGTAIGAAIELATKCFPEEESGVGRSIIVITDGENHEDDAVKAAKAAFDKGIYVNVVGIGSPNGAPIPLDSRASFLKDKEGNIVLTKLNENMCVQIATAGNGVYVRADNSNIALRTIMKEIDDMQKGEISSKNFAVYDEQFFVFAWIALVLLIIELFILNRQNNRLNKIKWF